MAVTAFITAILWLPMARAQLSAVSLDSGFGPSGRPGMAVKRRHHPTLTSFCRLLSPGGIGSPLARTRRPQLVNETSPT